MPESRELSIEKWGVMTEPKPTFIFHLLVPPSHFVSNNLDLKGEVIYFRLKIGQFPKFFELRKDQITPRYLGKLQSDDHIIEMIGEYPEERLGCPKKLKKAINDPKIKTELMFKIFETDDRFVGDNSKID